MTTQRTPADGKRVHFFPIRHHSPTCALALAMALEEVQPAQVLVEAPIDFEPLLPSLTDPAVKPPVAIVSMAETSTGNDPVSIYPFCAHSPEFVALAWARQAGVPAALIDLPACHEAMRQRFEGAAQGPLVDDLRLDHNRYVAELCARRGMPDGAALWDALFESHSAPLDWRGFFSAVGVYCEHIRAVTTAEEMEQDGTHPREAHMAARLHEAVEREGPIAVITGGFHTPALRAALETRVTAPPTSGPVQTAYLIRYGFRQIDRASGYGAGLPHPGWYDRLWTTLSEGRDPTGLALAVLGDFSDHLRRTAPGLSLSTPVLAQAGLAAARLASLRDLPFAGRSELLDALRSAAVKDAIELGHTPLLAAFSAFLTGDAIGDLPPGAAQPPTVETVRAQARALGFNLEGGQKRTRELDILRRPRHAQASCFLFALDLVDAQFATRVSGPDPLNGWREDALLETWTYAWSPMVESRLVSRAGDGQTLEALSAAELRRRRIALADQGLARSTGALAGLLLAAVRTGFGELATEVLEWCEEALVEDPEVSSVVRALALTASIAAGERESMGEACRHFRGRAFERLLLLFPHLAQTPPDRLNDVIRALSDLAALAGEDDSAVDRQALATMAANERPDAPPALNGALAAFAGLMGALSEEEVSQRVERVLDGAYVETGARAAALTGCLAVSPRLLVHSGRLMAATDRFLAHLDNSDFLAVLPELRLALGQLSPGEIDQVADWVADHHGLPGYTLAAAEISADEVAVNMRLSDRLRQVWRDDGLSVWLGEPA